MKDGMLILALLPLLFSLVLSADSMMTRFNFTLKETNRDIPLNVADDAVDDMYFGCQGAMMENVKSKYFHQDLQHEDFKTAWKKAAKCAQKKPKNEDKALTKDHMHAICVYTGEDIYVKFNMAVINGGSSYGRFRFHSLHFLLTSAIQILNSKSQCYNTYRRTNQMYKGNVDQRIRFGSFASTSFKSDLKQFGSKTCFKIKTCSGAFLRDYSAFGFSEAEVLIPPYEVFKIAEVYSDQGKPKDLKDCQVVFVLESLGIRSKLNCKAVNS